MLEETRKEYPEESRKEFSKQSWKLFQIIPKGVQRYPGRINSDSGRIGAMPKVNLKKKNQKMFMKDGCSIPKQVLGRIPEEVVGGLTKGVPRGIPKEVLELEECRKQVLEESLKNPGRK